MVSKLTLIYVNEKIIVISYQQTCHYKAWFIYTPKCFLVICAWLYLCMAVFALNCLPSLCKLRDKLKTDESAICCSLLQKSIVIWRLLAVAQAQAQCTGTWHRHRNCRPLQDQWKSLSFIFTFLLL